MAAPAAGHFTLILGPMFAGKSTEMLRRVRRKAHGRRRTLVFKYANDVRHGAADEATLTTHDGTGAPAVPVHDGVAIHAHIVQLPPAAWPQVVGIDEAQFLSGLEPVVFWLLQQGIDVVAAGLDFSYKAERWEVTAGLEWMADELLKVPAVCFACGSEYGTLSHMTATPPPDGRGELIGGAESYQALCRACWIKKNPGLPVRGGEPVGRSQ